MSRSHGVAGRFDDQAWTARARTPTYYPEAVTLARGCDVDALLAGLDTTLPGVSVKDSFADLDLTGCGFGVLFEAHWVSRPAAAPLRGSALEWNVVCDAAALRRWASVWDDGRGDGDVFRPALLDDPQTWIIAGHAVGGEVVAGAVANRGAEVVGLSNVFAVDGHADETWPMALEAVRSLCPGLPLVGYERGEDLAAAVRHGFEPIGPLRVWVRTDHP